MHRFVDSQTFAIRPVQDRGPDAGHHLRVSDRDELDECRLGRRLDFLDEIGEREPNPGNHHRPRFNAAMAIDALLECLAPEDVLEIHHARSLAFALYADLPW